jgi:uncharacterized protein YyaL (SSP411 family)
MRMPNQLQFEKSPYLLQHQNNPVHWLPWGNSAFEAAKAEDKPIFLSIGYSTCHWCHVMAHESFEDEAVAEAINRGFIPIKVDREERPDVDAVYMAACTALTGSGGWPLTVLMTPDQKPFWAGTYLPRKTLLSLLQQAERLWKENRERLLSAGDELTAYLQREEEARPGIPKRELAVRAAAQYAQSFDPDWGGFGQAPKFPLPHNLIFLMRYARCTGDGTAMKLAEKTLEAMYRGGLFDHVGGGFSRYSTDRRWMVPHFEKMLYDNALLIFAYAEAFQATRRPLYKTVVRRTVEYVLRELEAPGGGFYCGQDADSEGVEGKYYVFTPEELRLELGEDAARTFCRWYDVTARGNFEGSSIPNQIGQRNIEEEPEGMDKIREQLRQYRLSRTSLHKDDKILTAWNGLMIAGLARAGLVLEDSRCLEAARRAVEFINSHLLDQSGRLLARWREGQSDFPGKLEDYAFCAWGLLELYGATFQVQYLSEAEELAEGLLDFFFDWEHGGLYPYASDGEQLLTRAKEVYDGALPSGNGVAGLVFSRLARLTGETRWQEAEELQFSYLAGAVQAYPAGHSVAMLAFLEALWPAGELVCTGREVPAELMDLLRREQRPGLCVLVKTPENQEALSALAPFTAEYPIPQQGARYYLCKNGTCTRPVDSISELNWQESETEVPGGF